MEIKTIIASLILTPVLASCTIFTDSQPLAPADTQFHATDNSKLPVQTGNITVNGVDIPFTEVKNYFVNNTVTEMPPTKITSEAVFLKNFGMAAVMGEGGQPTPITFDSQFVIDVVLPSTDTATTVTPVSLKETNDGDLVFTYKITEGTKQSYTIRPFVMIAVDNAYRKSRVLLNPQVINLNQ